MVAAAVACLDALALPPDAPNALMLGAACLWIASKWSLGARAPPASVLAATLPTCCCVGRGGCGCGTARGGDAGTRRRLLRAEGEVLRALDYGARVLRRPTVESFLRPTLLQLQRARYRCAPPPAHPQRAAAETDADADAGSSCSVLSLCSLLSEESLLESQLLAFRPSVVAAACVAYAHALLGRPLREDLLPCAAGAGAPGPTPAPAMAAAAALAEVSAAADVLRAVHAAVAAAATAGNPYATTLRWLRLDAEAALLPPILGASDGRLAPYVAAASAARACGKARGTGSAWSWLLPAEAA